MFIRFRSSFIHWLIYFPLYFSKLHPLPLNLSSNPLYFIAGFHFSFNPPTHSCLLIIHSLAVYCCLIPNHNYQFIYLRFLSIRKDEIEDKKLNQIKKRCCWSESLVVWAGNERWIEWTKCNCKDEWSNLLNEI